jgi:hypothetical protein
VLICCSIEPCLETVSDKTLKRVPGASSLAIYIRRGGVLGFKVVDVNGRGSLALIPLLLNLSLSKQLNRDKRI